jgi:DNA-binding NarL/FixJ family response regulator
MSQTKLGTPKILIVDDHPLILGGILDVLRREYPEADILTAKTVQEALYQGQSSHLDLIIIDLSLPEKPAMTAQIEMGLQLLRQLMKDYPHLNIMVQSSYIKALVRVKHDIDAHQGGFTVADKGVQPR